MKACAKTPKPIPPQIKAAKARLEKSHKAAKEFEAELNEVIEEAREEGRDDARDEGSENRITPQGA